jgi:DNA-binding beta-propeller fold protein YncE
MKSKVLIAAAAWIVFTSIPVFASQAAPQCQAPPAPAQPAAAAPQAQRDLTVKGIPGVVAAGAALTQVFQTVGNNVDGIVAAADGSLLASQEDNNAVLRIDRNDRASIFLAGVAVGSLSIDRQGRLFAVRRMAQAGTPAATHASAPKTAGVSMLLPEFRMWDTFAGGGTMSGRPSDLSADSAGGAYFTQLCVYHVTGEGRISLVAQNVRGNGVLLSEDEKRLYVTNDASIVVFDVAGPGKLTNQREFTKLPEGGNADGLAVDTGGNLYVAAGPGVQIFSPRAAYLGLIPTPPGRPTGQAFAGPDRRMLYVIVQTTTDEHGRPMAGRTVYRIPMLAQGLPVRSK